MINNINYYNLNKKKYKKKILVNSNGTKSYSEYLFNNNKKLFFWVHGFNDYYYHYHIGDKLLSDSFDIYSISLRNYESSAKKRFCVKDLYEYVEDIDNHLKLLVNNYDEIILYGHSLGGLICSIYMYKGIYNHKINKLVLNSPFFNFRVDLLTSLIINYFSGILRNLRYFNILDNIKVSDFRGKDIYKEYIFENYHFDRKLKINDIDIYLDWILTVKYYQNELSKLTLSVPTFVFCPSKNATNNDLLNNNFGDTILDVNDIFSFSCNLFQNLCFKNCDNSIHDVFVSKPDVVNNAYNYMIDWLNKKKNKNKNNFYVKKKGNNFYIYIGIIFSLYFYNYFV